jgi:Subtilase family
MQKMRVGAIALAAAVSVAAWARPVVAQPSRFTLGPAALELIAASQREKAARTPAERKIDSQLLQEMARREGRTSAGRLAGADEITLAQDAAGRLIVDIMTTEAGAAALQADVARRGGEVLSAIASAASASRISPVSPGSPASPRSPASAGARASAAARSATLRASVSLDRLRDIAARPDVIFIAPGREPKTHRRATSAISATSATSAASATSNTATTGSATATAATGAPARLAHGGPTTDAFSPINTGQGSKTTEGDATHLAYLARLLYGVDGTGIKIGVLSDGVNGLSSSQSRGDLGPVTVLPGQGGHGGEGTALLEIIHDLAPGAQLYFATAFGGTAQYGQNIRDLRAAGCDIIIDDASYFEESAFQDGQSAHAWTTSNGGLVTQAVNHVTASGAIYFSSAGNDGNVAYGTGAVWEGDFLDGGADPGGTPGHFHDFGGGWLGNYVWDSDERLTLKWADPLGGSANDYDLFLFNADATAILSSSTNIQDGTQDPYESVSGRSDAYLVIWKSNDAAPRFLNLSAHRGRLNIVTNGQIHGHAAAAQAIAVAATPVAAPRDTGTPGPYPNPFTTANTVESFTSDGPRRMFFQADGTPYTPGNFSSTGGIVRQTPVITAADGVSVTGFSFITGPFYGTSAAVPHAAAIAALVMQSRPGITPAEVRAALIASAIDIEAPGVDVNSGAGIVMAPAAIAAAGGVPSAVIEVDSFTATDNPGDGDGFIVGGEGAALAVALTNLASITATNVTATLSTSSPYVKVMEPAMRSYGTIAAGAVVNGSGANGATPWAFTVASDAPCGLTIDFVLTVSFTSSGPITSRVIHLAVPIGTTIDINGTLGSPVSSAPSFTATTGIQTGRIAGISFGDSPTCARPRSYPGIDSTASLHFDAYTFPVCGAPAVSSCTPITLDGVNVVPMRAAAFAPAFNPASLEENYLGDSGTSAIRQNFSVDTHSNGPLVVTVYEAVANVGVGTSYHLRLTGMCGSCVRNGVPTATARNMTVQADASGMAAASIDNGSSDPDGDPLTITQSPAGPYPVGVTTVLLTVTDPKGATSQATAAVTVLPIVITPPAPTAIYLLGEGATGGFFDEDVLIANPNPLALVVTLTFFKEDGTTVTETRTIDRESHLRIAVDDVQGLEATAASVQVSAAGGYPLIVERSMFWDEGRHYAGHTAPAVSAPAMPGSSRKVRKASSIRMSSS